MKRIDFKDLVGKTIKRIDANFEYLGILTEDDCFAYLEEDVCGHIRDCKSIEDRRDSDGYIKKEFYYDFLLTMDKKSYVLNTIFDEIPIKFGYFKLKENEIMEFLLEEDKNLLKTKIKNLAKYTSIENIEKALKEIKQGK